MKFTFSWLKKFLDTTAELETVLETLNKIGLEVEEAINPFEKYKNFNVVYVEEAKKHPDSDHLNICKVIDKDNNIHQIVCGAPNVVSDMQAILAPIGSIIPNGEFAIKKSKIRGVESCGMLCSEKELFVGEDHDGIIRLKPNEYPLGTNITVVKNIATDPIIDISITPNRGDCLGVYGIARDLAVAGLGNLKNKHSLLKETFKANNSEKVKSLNPLLCPAFKFIEIENITNCESPEWLKTFLKSIDINPKNFVVDLSNYILYTFNKPLHIYDADKIQGNITIANAENIEEFTDLFDKKHKLNKDNLVIRDDEKILCLAGIVGSTNSATELKTKNIIIESALFDAVNIAKTGRMLNLNSDSRYRFERGIDYDDIEFACDYATQMILEICGGAVKNITTFNDADFLKKINRKISFNFNRIKEIVGIEIDKSTVLGLLNKLEYKILEEKNNQYLLEIPHYKNNILFEEDLIDDIIRIYGYDKLFSLDFTDTKKFERESNLMVKNKINLLNKVRMQLVSDGMIEILSYSFVKREESILFSNDDNDKLELINPIISDLSYMRQNLLPSLLNAIKKNSNRGVNNFSLFEIGQVFKSNTPEDENALISGVFSGNFNDKDLYNEGRKFDVFDAKKSLSACLEIFNIDATKLFIDRSTPNYYHPNKSGALKMGNVVVGYFGELSPIIQKAFDLKNPAIAFECFLDKLPKSTFTKNNSKKDKFAVNDLQKVERSFAFIVANSIEVNDIIRAVSSTSKDLIERVKIFDIYSDAKMDNKKSIALTVSIQPQNKTLTKEEIDNLSDKIVKIITEKFNGILRDGTN